MKYSDETISAIEAAIEAATYWRRLKGHPGVPIAIVVTIFGALERGWFGLVIGAVVWVPVLITARDQPI